MIRADLLPMKLQAYASGEPATPTPAAAISIMLDGSVHFNREPIEITDVLDLIHEVKTEDPETVIYVALEDGNGTVDRGPILTSLWDQLRQENIEISFVGKPKD
jgi:hypothetical protein